MRKTIVHILAILLLTSGGISIAHAQSAPVAPKSTITIKGNIYGGGNLAQVNGDTEVEVNTGELAGEVFGGGNGALNPDGSVRASADVNGSTQVTVNGGEIIYVADDHSNHNIYGGGNLACNVAGSSHVDMNTGIITTYTYYSNLAVTLPIWYSWYDQAMNPNQQKQPVCSVFGAGYGAKTNVHDSTYVHINIPGTSHIHPADGIAFTHAELENIDRLIMRWKPDTTLSEQFICAVHGGGYDGTVGTDAAYTSQTNVTIEGQPFIFHVYGGGLGSKAGADANGGVNSHVGAVYGAAKLDIRGGIINGDVFGGGAGIAGQAVIPNPFPGAMGGSTVNLPYTYAAQVMRETDVTISGNSTVVFGNVYGGGDIANTGWHDTKARPTMDGHVGQQNTSNARLDFTTSLHLNGGNILGNVFGGGNGRRKAEIEQYKFVGAVIGSTNVTLDGGKVWSTIYGGGNTGCVYSCETIAATQGGHGRSMQVVDGITVLDGSTNVSIRSGMVARDIFGGGYGDDPSGHEEAISSADVYGNTFVHFAQADLEFTHYWQPREVATNETMGDGNEQGGRFLAQNSDAEHRNTESDICHNLYGGGNMACTVYGNTHVYMSGAPTAPDGFNTSDYYNQCIANVAKPHFSAFGGGFGQYAVVRNNTYSDINLAMGTGLHSIVGGGMNGPVIGSTQVHVGNDPMSLVHYVYGGGYYAPCANTELEITRGTILENVYGGAVMGNINADGDSTDIATRMVIGLKKGTAVRLEDEQGRVLREYTYAQHQNQITIYGHVYGANDVSGTVNGIASLTMYGGTVRGDVYGAGNGDHIGYYVPNELRYDLGAHYNNYFYVDHRAPGMSGNTYVGRPQTIGGVNLTLAGNTEDERVTVLGQVFGGGNSCTIGRWDTTMLAPEGKYHGNPHLTRDDPDYFLGGGKLQVNLGSHVTIGRTHAQLAAAPDGANYISDNENVSGLYMGCSGRHLATQDKSKTNNYYHHYFDTPTGKYWPGFVVYDDGGETPLTRAEGLKSFNAYLNNILVWTDSVILNIPDTVSDVWLSNFVGGGFRGSMKAKTERGQFHYMLPRGVTIGHDVIGGAYNTDVVYHIFETTDGHAYTEEDGHYKYLTDTDGLTQYDPDTNPEGDYHHIEYAADGETVTGIIRFYYDGGMLSEHPLGTSDRSTNDRIGRVLEKFTTEGGGSDDNVGFSGPAEASPRAFRKYKEHALVYLDLQNKLETEVIDGHVHGGNVFGGCFASGRVEGDIWTDYRCYQEGAQAMDENFNLSDRNFANAKDFENNFAMMLFGAGYGANTRIQGDAYVRVLHQEENPAMAGRAYGYPRLYNVFGGSYEGVVDGNTNVYFNSGKYGYVAGAIYGGGCNGYVAGKSFLELAGGYIDEAYGGARNANIGGGSHVWAYDGTSRSWAEDVANPENAPLFIGRLYGGTDIAGKICTDPDGNYDAEKGYVAGFSAAQWPAELYNNGTDDSEGLKRFDSYIQVGGTDQSNNGYPVIGAVYAGGNGEKTAEFFGPAYNDALLPEVQTALLEVSDGNIVYAFGGGNQATVTDQNYILVRSPRVSVHSIPDLGGRMYDVMKKRVLNVGVDCYSESDGNLNLNDATIQRLFGGNNVAAMAIQPKWNLKEGKLGIVYSGGNLGDMTYYNAEGTEAVAGAVNLTPKGLSIHVESDDVEINELYGGCRLADVRALDNEGQDVVFGENEYGATVNVSAGRINNVYGGNDVAGRVFNGTNVNISGAISGDVYGSGNGNYIYLYDVSKDAPAAGVIEERHHTKGYIYYAFRGSDAKATETARLQAINAIRPNVDKAYLNIAGAEDHLVYVKGNVYCGGNASTVSGNNAFTKFDIGSYCVLNGVYMGSNGEQLGVNANIDRLREVNSFSLNSAALLKEYLNAVSMAALPRDFSIADDITEAYIGTFCLGGNLGSMTTTQPVHMTIPASVTIFNKVVGGCNNAYLSYNKNTTTGGFINWNSDKTLPKITLDIYARFVPYKMNVPESDAPNFNALKAIKFLDSPLNSAGTMLDDKFCNVYGGCYTRGYVYGDVVINMYSDMIGDFDTEILQNNIVYNETNGRPVFSIFGGGYGSSTVIYGNTHIRLLNNHNTIGPARGGEQPPLVHPSVNAIYGGGEQGKMIGTALIHVADGTVYSNVVGGALAGNIYGNTEILVGYPSYYEVQKTGEYKMKRSNFTAEELAKTDGSGDKAVRQSIFLTKGDRINAAVYQAIRDYGNATQTAALTLTQNKVQKDWDDIEINIKGGIYGGGYSRANVEDGQTAMVNTVLKFTSSYNLSTAHPEYWTATNTLTQKEISKSGEYVYGGNSTILVQDAVNAQNFATFDEGEKREHITISTEMDPVAHTGRGGIYGDGHSSLVAAFRSASVEGYGYAEHAADSVKLLNTFQRFDILQIRDCAMKMYGDIDVATGQNDTTHYAVSRITELMLNSHIDDTQDLLPTNQRNSRNVIDFYNPVHYLGSITSEVTFKPLAQSGSRYHDINGAVVSDSSYYDYKSVRIARNFDYAEHGIRTENGCKEAFGARNAGTAKNLIRIDDPQGRGVHLKVVQENNYAINSQGVKEEQSFYGPLSGVFEFQLTNVNARGGGYVYSNNIHEQTVSASGALRPGGHGSEESFLQTSGNVFFVPVQLEGKDKERQVYDDCYPIPYSEHDGQLDLAHYWFVEGDGPTWCSYPEKPRTVNEATHTITINTGEELAWIYDYIDHGYDSGKESRGDTTYSVEHDIYPAGFDGWNIELGNDIDLGQLTILDQREVEMIWCPIADQKGTVFRGNFDGKGYKIDGMLLDVDFITTKNTYGNENYADGYDHYFGLFAKTEGGTIQNVELSNARVLNLNGNTNERVHIGTLITQIDHTTVQDCSVQLTDSILTNKANEVEAAAAFICHTTGTASTLERNFVSGTILAPLPGESVAVSGFISTLGHGSTMEHCYSLVDVTAPSVAGLIDTLTGNAVLEHAYYAGTLTRTDPSAPWGAVLANKVGQGTVKHCYYDATNNPIAKGYQGSDTNVFSYKASGYTTWSTYGLTTQEMSDAESGHVWRSCYSHGHTREPNVEYQCEQDGEHSRDEIESAWNKGKWTFINGFYPFLKSQEIDCSALTTTFVMPTAESLHMTSQTGIGEQGWYNIDRNFQLPTYGHMYWTVANNTLLLDSITARAQDKVNAHLYLGGPDALTLNCDEYVRWMREIYVTRQDINSPEDATWFASLSTPAKTALAEQLNKDAFTVGLLRNKEVTNISRTKVDGNYVENGYDGDLNIWNREGSAGSVTNLSQYTVNGTITYYTGYENPYLWHEVNIPFDVRPTDGMTVFRTKSGNEYPIAARMADIDTLDDGGNFWLRSFETDEEILFGGSTFQQAWHDPAVGENYGHRPSVLRFPRVMKVDGTEYQSGDYWCYAQNNTIDGVPYNNGGSEFRIRSVAGSSVYGSQDWDGHEDYRGAGNGYSFRVYGNPTLGNIQLEGYYWTLEADKRDTTGVNDKIVPEFGTDVAQWFSLQQDPVIPPLGLWMDGPDDFKQAALDEGSNAPIRLSGLHEPGVSEMFDSKQQASFTASGHDGLLGVFSFIDQIINIYDVNGHLTFTTPVRANTGFTLNLPSTLFLVQGTNSPQQVKVLL